MIGASSDSPTVPSLNFFLIALHPEKFHCLSDLLVLNGIYFFKFK